MSDQAPPEWLRKVAYWFVAIVVAGVLADMFVAWRGPENAAELALFIVFLDVYRRQEGA